MTGYKLYKVCDSSFFSALGLILDNDAGRFILAQADHIVQYMKMHYNEITTLPADQIPGNPDFPTGAAINAGFFAAAYGDAVTKTYDAIHIMYDALSLIDLEKEIEFDATDSNDRTLSSSSDSTSNSSTTFDSSTPVLTGQTSHTYTRNDNADITMDHDTTEHTTGTDGRRSPQELIQSEIDFRARNIYIDYLCCLCKDAFDSGIYEEEE